MIRSMTAYARATVQLSKSHYALEIISLNKKNLDIHIHMPKEFFSLEMPIRKKIAEAASRGAISLRITPSFSIESPGHFPDDESCLHMKALLEKKQRLLGFNDKLSFAFILDQCEKFLHNSEINLSEIDEKLVLDNINLLLENWIIMKKKEGKSLLHDVKGKLDTIQTKLPIIQKLSVTSIERYKDKLKGRIAEIAADIGLEEERLAKEVLYFADRIDINEEIVRLHSHIMQFGELLSSHDFSIGKTLDFLLQEMSRETNSLGVKSQELEISKLVIEMKSDLEKIREQVQNIE